MKLDLGETSAGDLVIARCRHGLFLFNRRDLLGRALDTYGEWAEPEIELLTSLVRPDDVVIDVGANIGADTVPLACRVGPKGLVIAMEPQPVMYKLLCTNLVLNGLANVQPLNHACGDRSEVIAMPVQDYLHAHNFSGLSLTDSERVPAESGHPVFDPTQVECVVLDDRLAGLPSCRLLKVDVEGMEGAVLRGADGLIRKHRPLLYCEVNQHETGDALLAQIRDLGYQPYWHVFPGFNPDNHARHPHDVFDGRGDANVVALPEGIDFDPSALRPAQRFDEVYEFFPGVLKDPPARRKGRRFWPTSRRKGD